MDAYDDMHAARLKALDRFGVTSEGLQPRYRCVRSDTVLTPSIPLTGDIVQHVCRACGRSVEQNWREYDNQKGMMIDIRCPSEHQHPDGPYHEEHPLVMLDVRRCDNGRRV